MIQDGKNVVFEVAIAGTFHKVTATDVFERGESIYLSGYYKDGYAGILVNGKVPVNKVFQINSDKLERLNSNSSENNIINNLSSVDGEVFNSLSDFKKTLKKCIGRRAYKKYGDEIVQLAGEN